MQALPGRDSSVKLLEEATQCLTCDFDSLCTRERKFTRDPLMRTESFSPVSRPAQSRMTREGPFP